MQREIQGIYVIKSAPGLPVKVGVTANLERRLLGLQVGNWNELSPHWFSFVGPSRERIGRNFFNSLTNSAFRLETLVHRTAKELGIAVGGEWLDCDPAAAVMVVQKVAAINNLEFFDLRVMAGLSAGQKLDKGYMKLARGMIDAQGAALNVMGP